MVESYSFLATRRLNGPERARYLARTLAEAPRLLSLDRQDRGDFLRHFYRRYEDAPVEQIDEDAAELFSRLILTKSFPAGIRRVREHRALGHRTILITGALDFAVAGLRPLFDEIVAASMTVRRDGTYSGEMSTVPPTGETRAQILADYCASGGPAPGGEHRLRRLHQRPADARGRRLPGGGQPGDPPRRPGPQARLAGRAVEQGAGRAPTAAAARPDARRARAAPHVRRRDDTASLGRRHAGVEERR